ncbi:hypothetical protein SCHPADRAFT_992296 [Schizopora paradoxa]|uniref:Peroxisomal membrane protein PEX14 n=1 Tax=Schizopora paradoxa TaxID=27342 RepID=A0A0H2S7I5_9AGAM|nr:hypothetical protein SCHPADRAFT_992296 [Schizopora paradoxa]
MATPDRRALMDNAISFLRDPNSQASSFAQRIQFLEAKGLTPDEIQEAMHQAALSQGPSQYPQYTPYPQYGASPYPMGPMGVNRPPLDWRDYFIMAVVSGSFMYGAVALARKYLMPHLKPPSSTVYEEDRDALAAQFDVAEALLKEIQEETREVKESVEAQKVKVDQAAEDVEAAVKDMREGEIRTRDEMREIREEVNSIRDMLPKMIDKNKEAQSNSLAELQQELKSLKALLLSRGPSFPSSTSPAPTLSNFGRPSIPAWQLANSISNTQNGVFGESSSSGSGSVGPLSTPVPARASTGGVPVLDGPASASASSTNLNSEALSQPESL